MQRVPETEKRGRRHTSTVTVAVLPLPPEDPEDRLDPGDLEITTQRGHGKGGQHQNKTDSAVRIVHRPTGVSVFVNGRDQHANRRDALRILTARLAAMRRDSLERARSDARRAQTDGGGRSNKLRTYNFIDGRVVDHRLGTKTSRIDEVMKGRFELLF